VVVFSKSWCPYCEKTKSLFDELAVPYSALEPKLQKFWRPPAGPPARSVWPSTRTAPLWPSVCTHSSGCGYGFL